MIFLRFLHKKIWSVIVIVCYAFIFLIICVETKDILTLYSLKEQSVNGDIKNAVAFSANAIGDVDFSSLEGEKSTFAIVKCLSMQDYLFELVYTNNYFSFDDGLTDACLSKKAGFVCSEHASDIRNTDTYTYKNVKYERLGYINNDNSLFEKYGLFITNMERQTEYGNNEWYILGNDEKTVNKIFNLITDSCNRNGIMISKKDYLKTASKDASKTYGYSISIVYLYLLGALCGTALLTAVWMGEKRSMLTVLHISGRKAGLIRLLLEYSSLALIGITLSLCFLCIVNGKNNNMIFVFLTIPVILFSSIILSGTFLFLEEKNE